jgi:hypothetical protein
VNFRDENGNILLNYQKSIQHEGTLGDLKSLSKDGYTFVGWIPCAPARRNTTE